MAHLVFNSFPRSGNVFISNIANHAFSMNISAVHLPEIYGVDGLYNVAVFRKPEDSISSLINKSREYYPVSTEDGVLDTQHISHVVQTSLDTYSTYLEKATLNLDKIQVIVFKDLIQDYETAFKTIAAKFSLNLNDNYQSKVNLNYSSDIWSNKYDGHAPRESDEIRLEIEKFVSSLDSVKEMNDRYFELLSII